MVTLTAKWLILLSLAKQDAAVAGNSAMADIGKIATLDTDGVYLRDIVSNGAEGRHGAERYAFIIHVKTCDDNSDASVGQFIADIGQAGIEELRFVNAYDVNVAG